MVIDGILAAASAARAGAPAPGDERYAAYCTELAGRLDKRWDEVTAGNRDDVERARAAGLAPSLVDRLTLADRHLGRLMALAEETRGLLPVVTAAGPARPAGERITLRRTPKPLGTMLMVYEARPTVTVEGALLAVGVGNVVLLRGGSEMAATDAVLASVVTEAIAAAGLPDGMAQVLTGVDRRSLRELLRRHDAVDVLIPRGSPSLIDYCCIASSIPVLASGGGVNHLYVDRGADLDRAATLALDSKLGEPTACNTLELLLVHADVAADLTRRLLAHGERLAEPYVLRLDPSLLTGVEGGGRTDIRPLAQADDGREFLDRSIGVRPVAGVGEAIAHIRRYGSRHTEGVVSDDPAVVEEFLRAVDAAALVVNGSLRLHDGPTLGLGPELSISTGRLHVRGPVGLAALLTHSWVIDGHHAIRGQGGES